MTASISRPAEQPARPGGLGWLPASLDHAGFRVVLARRCPAGTVVARAVSALAEPGVLAKHWP
jgi:hypothetical protein